mgnify:CR=1 FL=1
MNMRKKGKEYLDAERQKQGPDNGKTVKGKSVTNVTKQET